MTDIQQSLLVMLEWFHELCERNGLKYCALGGTVLGAIRHHGFIPWDDDVDIGMPRESYMRLREVISKENQDRFVLETPDSNAKDYLYCHSKLYDSNTTVVEKRRFDFIRGLYLDIFPLDGMGDNRPQAKIHFNRVFFRSMFATIRCLDGIEGNSIKNWVIYCCKAIPLSTNLEKKLIIRADQIASKIGFETSKYGGNPFGHWKSKEIMDRGIIGTPKMVPFETIQIYVPERVEEYLSHLYGNWMVLPPVSKRVNPHTFKYVNLKLPYKNYALLTEEQKHRE